MTEEEVVRYRLELMEYLTCNRRIDVNDADDLTQNAFVVWLEKLKEFRSTSAWLKVVARFDVSDLRRERKRRARILKVIAHRCEKAAADPAEEYALAELLEQALASLPKRHRRIWRYYNEDVEVSEIARRFNVSPGRIYQIIREAKSRLKKYIRSQIE